MVLHTCFTVDILIPLFSIRDPESWGVRLSYLLPPPRTILGAIARGLGTVLGFRSGEENVKGLAVREILTLALELSTFATVRPLAPIIRHPQLLRIVPAIEKGEQPTDLTKAHDAFKHDILFTYRLRLILTPNLENLNAVLQKYEISAVQETDLLASMQLFQQIGNTESLCSPQGPRQLKPIKADINVVNTYSPLKWIEPALSNGIIASLLVNLRLLETFDDSYYIKRKGKGVELVRDPQLRRKKAMFCLPLYTQISQRGKELLIPAEVLVKPKPGYAIYTLADGTSLVLPGEPA